MNIIVKKYQSHGMFRPHYSNSFGHYVATKKEYLSEMKRLKLEPYNPNQPERKIPDAKISSSGKEIINSIYQQTGKNGKFKPTGQLKEKLIKMGVIKTKSDVAKIEKQYRKILKEGNGGFSKGDK